VPKRPTKDQPRGYPGEWMKLIETELPIKKSKGVVARDKKGLTRCSAGKPRVDEPPKLADLGITKGESQADAYKCRPGCLSAGLPLLGLKSL
jgi:hypothetical protein